ncbi:unnamed protein product [Medioppia subpectinata]|uniref:BZIP domain-containing protein n=1 Tax=Medioppia subpectinata TaxID=1979941 RepID=A0A7R9PWV1_9ACAR|nr:unnamed protein product [Medioppia subpectinata]CAG2104138.1 unnamed protein product [Medioppia subpectinata]
MIRDYNHSQVWVSCRLGLSFYIFANTEAELLLTIEVVSTKTSSAGSALRHLFNSCPAVGMVELDSTDTTTALLSSPIVKPMKESKVANLRHNRCEFRCKPLSVSKDWLGISYNVIVSYTQVVVIPTNCGTDDVPQQEVEAICNPFLSKHLSQQQRVMALHQNNDNIPKHIDTNSQQNSRNNITNDRFWFDQNTDNTRNQSKQTVNISALKHDHPLIASAVDNIGPKSSNALCGNESILVASLPPTEPQILSQTGQWFDENDYICDRKAICLPFGYCIDDEKASQYHSHISLNMSDNDADWMCDNTNMSYNGVTGYPYCIDNSFNMENVFQVDKADIKTGPTLAQLNASDVWDALDLDDLLASAQMDVKHMSNRSRFASNSGYRLNNNSAITSMDYEYDSKLQENIDYLTSLLNSSKSGATLPQQPVSSDVKPLPTSSLNTIVITTQTVPQEMVHNSQLVTQKSVQKETAAKNSGTLNQMPTTTVLSTLLGAQPIKQKLLSNDKSQPMPQTSSSSALISQSKTVSNSSEENKVLSRVRNNSMSTEYSVSSHDEGFASQPEDTDNEDDDMDSDDESFYGDYDASDLLGASTSDDANNKWSLNMGRSRKGGERRYFWQYNVQSKGPKGTRIAAVEENSDPHVFKEISDPVFSPDCQIEGVKHSGKARRGDGNDLTPNPKKLLMIGLELKKLSKIINELTPVAEVPVSSRGKSRKEKNKLASRACRLKKKAQHEANKIKLYGLQMEHKKIMVLLSEVKKYVRLYGQNTNPNEVFTTQAVERLIKQKGPLVPVAGKTSDFVNHILDNVAAGVSNGGLDKI